VRQQRALARLRRRPAAGSEGARLRARNMLGGCQSKVWRQARQQGT